MQLYTLIVPTVTERTGTKFFTIYTYNSRINRATSFKMLGPVYHPMEQLIYKFYVYIANDIDFI